MGILIGLILGFLGYVIAGNFSIAAGLGQAADYSQTSLLVSGGTAIVLFLIGLRISKL